MSNEPVVPRKSDVTGVMIEPLREPFNGSVPIPGSKSITNRALVAALLADGTSTLRGALDADDTQAMVNVAKQLGAQVQIDGDVVSVDGTAGAVRANGSLDVRMSGTTARFATPLAARSTDPVTIDGAPEMRARPMRETAEALRSLGCDVDSDVLPMIVRGPFDGGVLHLAADVSSQFASGMLLAAPGVPQGLTVELEGAVVSQPYLDMTCDVMQAFGADVQRPSSRSYVVGTAPYQAADYRIEPDASAASYFFAAAAVTESRVRVEGLHRGAMQGDVRFVDVLAQMGAEVRWHDDAVEVRGTGELRGVEVDMAHISDTAQTLAAIAPFAQGPTRVTGIGFIRRKETDRIAAVVTELQRLGINAAEEADGFAITPGAIRPATVRTYSDHRMAMSFAITGLKAPGVTIQDPSCVNKTFPGFWQTLDTVRGGA